MLLTGVLNAAEEGFKDVAIKPSTFDRFSPPK